MARLNHAVIIVRTQDDKGRYVYYMQDNEYLHYLGGEEDIPENYLSYVKEAMGSEYPF